MKYQYSFTNKGYAKQLREREYGDYDLNEYGDYDVNNKTALECVVEVVGVRKLIPIGTDIVEVHRWMDMEWMRDLRKKKLEAL